MAKEAGQRAPPGCSVGGLSSGTCGSHSHAKTRVFVKRFSSGFCGSFSPCLFIIYVLRWGGHSRSQVRGAASLSLYLYIYLYIYLSIYIVSCVYNYLYIYPYNYICIDVIINIYFSYLCLYISLSLSLRHIYVCLGSWEGHSGSQECGAAAISLSPSHSLIYLRMPGKVGGS